MAVNTVVKISRADTPHHGGHQEGLTHPVGEGLELSDGGGGRGHLLHAGLLPELPGHLGNVPSVRIRGHDAVRRWHYLSRHALYQLGLVGAQFLKLGVGRRLVHV